MSEYYFHRFWVSLLISDGMFVPTAKFYLRGFYMFPSSLHLCILTVWLISISSISTHFKAFCCIFHYFISNRAVGSVIRNNASFYHHQMHHHHPPSQMLRLEYSSHLSKCLQLRQHYIWWCLRDIFKLWETLPREPSPINFYFVFGASF